MTSCIGCYGIRGIGLAAQDAASSRAAMLKSDRKAQWKAMLASKSERAAAQAQVNRLLVQARKEAAARYRAAGDIARAELAAGVRYNGTLEELGKQVGLSGFRGIGSLGLEVDTKASIMTAPSTSTITVAAASYDALLGPAVAKQADAYIASALATLSPKEEWTNAIATDAGKAAVQKKIAALVETARGLAVKRYQAVGDYARATRAQNLLINVSLEDVGRAAGLMGLRGLRGLGEVNWASIGSSVLGFFGKLIDNQTAQSNAEAQAAQAEAQRRAAEAQAAAQAAALAQQAAVLAAAEAEKQKKTKLIIGLSAGAIVLGVGAFVFLKR